MTPKEQVVKKKRPVKMIIVFILLTLLGGSGLFIYSNFNRLLSEALLRSFNSSIISDVYELKFEKLRVNILQGSIHVNNVVLEPRETPLQKYPYINSSFVLRTEKLHLKKVDLYVLLNEGTLKLEEITIKHPDINLFLNGEKHIFFPFKDSTKLDTSKHKKRAIVGFQLNQFQLLEASFHGVNSAKESEFEIHGFSITLQDLSIDQQTGKDLVSCKQLALSIGESFTNTKNTPLKHVLVKSFTIGIDSLHLTKSIDTLIYHFKDFKTELTGLDIQTADSINHISLGSLKINYKDSSLLLKNILFKPNISDAAIQKKFKYQKVNASGSLGTLNMKQIDFDSLIYYRKVYIGEIFIDSATATVFKDKLKPMDTKRFPEYFGQDIPKIPIPLLIKRIKASHLTLYNTERKPDSAYAKVSLTRGNATLENITNLRKDKPLVLKADAYIDNRVRFYTTLNFSYLKPQFSFKGGLRKFDLTKLNHLIQGYTPASVTRGMVDEISFSGIAEKTHADGTMKFLYHDLKVDLELQHKKKWKSSVITFAANSILPSCNPSSAGSVPRVVNFHADRDMNKAFINIVLKSLISGLKETMIMSKENKKKHKQEVGVTKKKLIKWKKNK
jgi:hypothetical protein